MEASMRLLLKQLPTGEIVAVIEQSLGVDIPAGVPTPLREGVRLNLRLENADPAALLLLNKLIRGLLPLIERCMPPALRRHKPSEGFVVISGEPGDANGTEWGRVVHGSVL